jgi:hypothetical protein
LVLVLGSVILTKECVWFLGGKRDCSLRSIKTGCWAHPTLCITAGLFLVLNRPQCETNQVGHGVKLTMYVLLVSRLRMCGVIVLFPHES